MPVTRNQSSAAAAAAAAKSSSDAAATSGLKDNTDGSGTSTEAEQSGRESAENCSICLGPFNNKSFTSSCAHSFCFVCLKQWSKVKAECPLCKQPFTGIFHNIRSNDSYDVYELPPVNPPSPFDYSYLYNYMGGNLTSFAPAPHYFSLGQPSLDADLTLSNFSRFQFRHRRYDRYFNLEHPLHGEHQYSYSGSSFNPASHISAASWSRGAENFRLQVYKRHMGPPAVIIGCENSTYRLTPSMVAASSHRLHRIMPWLTRELRVLFKSHQSVRQAISVIQPLLTQVTIDSEYFNERASPHLGHRSRQFIQEFKAFANSALSMQAFDRKAMYRYSGTRMIYEDDNSSSSSDDDDDDDDVIEVTNVSPNVQAHSVASSSNATTSTHRAGWDSPTPGPSWESVGAHTADPPVETETLSVSSESDDPVFRPGQAGSDSDSSQTGSDIVFVKYDKPWGERSPVQLSSDSDEGEERKRKKKVKCKQLLRKSSRTSFGSLRKNKRQRSQTTSQDRVKTKSKISSRGGYHHVLPSTTHKAISSLDKQKKKRRRLRNKNSKNLGHDGELTESVAQTQDINVIDGSEHLSIPCPEKGRDGQKRVRESCDKDRHKHKKRKLNRDAASQSGGHSYKKHPSGHKNSSKTSARNQESERRHQHGHTSAGDIRSENSDRTGSSDGDQQTSGSLPHVGHTIASTIQASYLARPDTVQHIPLNLWVSTWPSLPVSHTFPAPPPPSSSFPLSSVAASTDLLNLSNPLSEYNAQTISSESDSSSDSDSEDSPDVSALEDRSRSRQWARNFPDASQQSASSSMTPAPSSVARVMRNWGIEDFTAKTSLPDDPTGRSDDIVSVESGDEDVVICSSASSEESDSDEVKVIEISDAPVEESSPPCDKNFGQRCEQKEESGNLCVSYLEEESEKPAPVLISGTSSPDCSSVPNQNSSSTKCNIDLGFPSKADNSEGDGEIASGFHLPDKLKNISGDVQPTSIQSSQSPLVDKLGTDLSPLGGTEMNEVIQSATVPLTSSEALESPRVGSDSFTPVSPSSHSLKSVQSYQTSASTLSPASSSSQPAFSVLPPLTASAPPGTSILSTNLTYLPYPPLNLSASVTSILSQPVSYLMPQAPTPPHLSVHFPFPPIQPYLPSPSALFSSSHPGISDSAQVAITASYNSETTGMTLESPHSSPQTDSMQAVAENIDCAADGSKVTRERADISLACGQDDLSSLLHPRSKDEIISIPSSSEETLVIGDGIAVMQSTVELCPDSDFKISDYRGEFDSGCLKDSGYSEQVESRNCTGSSFVANEKSSECAANDAIVNRAVTDSQSQAGDAVTSTVVTDDQNQTVGDVNTTAVMDFQSQAAEVMTVTPGIDDFSQTVKAVINLAVTDDQSKTVEPMSCTAVIDNQFQTVEAISGTAVTVNQFQTMEAISCTAVTDNHFQAVEAILGTAVTDNQFQTMALTDDQCQTMEAISCTAVTDNQFQAVEAILGTAVTDNQFQTMEAILGTAVTDNQFQTVALTADQCQTVEAISCTAVTNNQFQTVEAIFGTAVTDNQFQTVALTDEQCQTVEAISCTAVTNNQFQTVEAIFGTAVTDNQFQTMGLTDDHCQTMEAISCTAVTNNQFQTVEAIFGTAVTDNQFQTMAATDDQCQTMEATLCTAVTNNECLTMEAISDTAVTDNLCQTMEVLPDTAVTNNECLTMEAILCTAVTDNLCQTMEVISGTAVTNEQCQTSEAVTSIVVAYE